jgi:ankyrin repeat protein
MGERMKSGLKPSMKFVAGIITVISTFQLVACSPHMIGEQSVSDVFPLAPLAELAKQSCEGDLRGVRTALADGADPNGRGVGDVTPLFWAVSCQNAEGVRALLEAGADPNASFGTYSATFQAGGFGSTEILVLLFEHGGDINAVDSSNGDSLLGQAFSYGRHSGDWGNWKEVLKRGANVNSAKSLGRPVAITAVLLGEFEAANDLLDAGYSHDLSHLLASSRLRRAETMSAASNAARDRLIARLNSMGVVEQP